MCYRAGNFGITSHFCLSLLTVLIAVRKEPIAQPSAQSKMTPQCTATSLAVWAHADGSFDLPIWEFKIAVGEWMCT